MVRDDFEFQCVPDEIEDGILHALKHLPRFVMRRIGLKRSLMFIPEEDRRVLKKRVCEVVKERKRVILRFSERMERPVRVPLPRRGEREDDPRILQAGLLKPKSPSSYISSISWINRSAAISRSTP